MVLCSFFTIVIPKSKPATPVSVAPPVNSVEDGDDRRGPRRVTPPSRVAGRRGPPPPWGRIGRKPSPRRLHGIGGSRGSRRRGPAGPAPPHGDGRNRPGAMRTTLRADVDPRSDEVSGG